MKAWPTLSYKEKVQRCLWAAVIAVPIGLFIGVVVASNSPSGFRPTEAPLLEKLSAVFLGNPSQAQIKRELDSILVQFRQEPSSETYSILGNVLVRMRKDSGTGVTEMDILNCMRTLGSSLGNKYVEGAAMCAAALDAGLK